MIETLEMYVESLFNRKDHEVLDGPDIALTAWNVVCEFVVAFAAYPEVKETMRRRIGAARPIAVLKTVVSKYPDEDDEPEDIDDLLEAIAILAKADERSEVDSIVEKAHKDGWDNMKSRHA